LGIFALLEHFLFHLDSDLEEYFNNFDYKAILLIIGMTIVNFGLDLSTLFTIKNNTPCHALIIGEFMTITANIIYSEDIDNLIIIIICCAIIFFFSLIFNEIIEINCFGLSDNTRRNIMKREKKDDLIIFREPSADINENDRNSMISLEMNVKDPVSLGSNEIYD
jgi:hypothetical protein